MPKRDPALVRAVVENRGVPALVTEIHLPPEEQELLRKTARDFLEECAPVKHAREVMESDASHSAEAWRRMAELGWTGLPFPEEAGGAGLGMVELCIVLEELGRVLAPVPFLPTLMAGAAIQEVGTDSQRREWLLRGIQDGDPDGCDTFGRAGLRL